MQTFDQTMDRSNAKRSIVAWNLLIIDLFLAWMSCGRSKSFIVILFVVVRVFCRGGMCQRICIVKSKLKILAVILITTFDQCDDRGDIICIYYCNYGFFGKLGNYFCFQFFFFFCWFLWNDKRLKEWWWLIGMKLTQPITLNKK